VPGGRPGGGHTMAPPGLERRGAGHSATPPAQGSPHRSRLAEDGFHLEEGGWTVGGMRREVAGRAETDLSAMALPAYGVGRESPGRRSELPTWQSSSRSQRGDEEQEPYYVDEARSRAEDHPELAERGYHGGALPGSGPGAARQYMEGVKEGHLEGVKAGFHAGVEAGAARGAHRAEVGGGPHSQLADPLEAFDGGYEQGLRTGRLSSRSAEEGVAQRDIELNHPGRHGESPSRRSELPTRQPSSRNQRGDEEWEPYAAAARYEDRGNDGYEGRENAEDSSHEEPFSPQRGLILDLVLRLTCPPCRWFPSGVSGWARS
jgi:hypothetical protein